MPSQLNACLLKKGALLGRRRRRFYYLLSKNGRNEISIASMIHDVSRLVEGGAGLCRWNACFRKLVPKT